MHGHFEPIADGAWLCPPAGFPRLRHLARGAGPGAHQVISRERLQGEGCALGRSRKHWARARSN
eukprot:8814425-Pyramimonas_sp.AAC.1